MNDRAAPLIFSVEPYGYLQEAIARIGGWPLGQVESAEFPDGERYDRILTPTDGRDVVIVGGTISDQTTLAIYDLASAAVKYGAKSLILVVPFFGYATMERAAKVGEVVRAKTRARLLSSIPEAQAGNRIFLLDLHSEGIPFYFELGIRTTHVYAKPLVKAAARGLYGDDFVLACTDAGRAKWVESLANDLGVSASFIIKRRLSADRTEVAAVSAHVQDKNVIIYDDMIRTGGSLIEAAKAYKQAGAGRMSAIATHGLFPGEALARLRSTGLFETVICTDSHPRALDLADDFLQVRSVAELLATELQGKLGSTSS